MKTAKLRSKRVIPGFGLSLGVTILMLSLLILIPLASILVYAFHLSFAEFWGIILAADARNAIITSVFCAFLAALVNALFGFILAWVIVRYDFPGKRVLDGLIELPFAIPTAVAGITLSKMYSTTGLIGSAFALIGIRISYTHAGLIIALVFIGIPFVVRSVQPVLEQFDPQYEEAAFVLGAGRGVTFWRVVFPELLPSLLTGFGLAFARGIGEYGSVIYISGNSARDKTQVASYVIMQRLNYADYAGATAVALVMLILSFVVLLLVNAIQIHEYRRTNDAK